MRNEIYSEYVDLLDPAGKPCGDKVQLRNIRFVTMPRPGQQVIEHYIAPTFEQFFDLCEHLATNVEALRHQGANFDTVITAANGGMVPAKMVGDLAGMQDIKVATLGLVNYSKNRKMLDKPRLAHGLPVMDIAGDVLGVDDIFDSLRTFVYIEEEVRKQLPKGASFYAAAPFHRLKDGREKPNDFLAQLPEKRIQQGLNTPENIGEYNPVLNGLVTAVNIDADPWVIFPTDRRETKESLTESWNKSNIDPRIQEIRLRIIRSTDYKEQVELAAMLNHFS